MGPTSQNDDKRWWVQTSYKMINDCGPQMKLKYKVLHTKYTSLKYKILVCTHSKSTPIVIAVYRIPVIQHCKIINTVSRGSLREMLEDLTIKSYILCM